MAKRPHAAGPVGILGSGEVGQALGSGFAALGHEVMMGTRRARDAKASAWVKKAGATASRGSLADAASFGEILVFAVPATANLDVVKAAGADAFAGKTVIDATNAIDESGAHPELALASEGSAGEQLQRALPKARVVKCFNTVAASLMFRPETAFGPPDMFIAGDDARAKKTVTAILKDFGWPSVIDFGPIRSARWLEAMTIAWLYTANAKEDWDIGWKAIS
jgi:predicted dinucleotide-binding enzyme